MKATTTMATTRPTRRRIVRRVRPSGAVVGTAHGLPSRGACGAGRRPRHPWRASASGGGSGSARRTRPRGLRRACRRRAGRPRRRRARRSVPGRSPSPAGASGSAGSRGGVRPSASARRRSSSRMNSSNRSPIATSLGESGTTGARRVGRWRRQARWSDSTARRKPARTCSASWFGRIVAARAGSQRNAARIASGQRHGRESSSGGTSGTRRIARRPSSSRISPDSDPANDGPSCEQRRPGRRAGGRADLAEAHDALVVGHPEHGEPPVVGSVHGLGHPGLEAAIADADLLLAQERGAGVREAFGHRARGYRAGGQPRRRRRARLRGLAAPRRLGGAGPPGAARRASRGRRAPAASSSGAGLGASGASASGAACLGHRLVAAQLRDVDPEPRQLVGLERDRLGDQVRPLGLHLEAQHLAPHVVGRRREDLGGGRRRVVHRDLAGDERQQAVVARLRDLGAGAQDGLGVQRGDALDLGGRVRDRGERGPAGRALLDPGLGQERRSTTGSG